MTVQQLAAADIASVQTQPTSQKSNRKWKLFQIFFPETETKAVIQIKQSFKVVPYIQEKVQGAYLIFFNHY